MISNSIFWFTLCSTLFVMIGSSQLGAQIDENTRLSRIKQMVELNHFLNNLEETDFQEGLEITVDQLRELQTIRAAFDVHMNRVMNSHSVIADPLELERSWTEAIAASVVLTEQMRSTLLPHQLGMYEQYVLLRESGLKDSIVAICEGVLAQKLNLSDEQKQTARAVAEKAKQRLDGLAAQLKDDIDSVNRAAGKESLKVLDTNQRKDYDRLVGEKEGP